MKYIITTLAVLMLSGCNLTMVPKKEVVTQKIPVLYCPKPNWGNLQEPVLATQGITDNTSAGEVVKRYKAAMIQLQDYNDRLVKTLQQYDATHAAYEQLRQEFLKERKLDGFSDQNDK